MMDEDKVLAVLERLEVGQRDLARTVTEQFQRVDERLQQVDRRFERFDQRLDQFRVVAMDRFEKIEDRLTSMLGDMTVNFGAVTHMSHRQDNDREEMRSLHNLVMTLVTKLHRLQTNVEELQRKAS